MHPCSRVELDFIDRAPIRFSNTVAIALSPDELFEVLARADTWPRWASVITGVTYTSPEPYGVGTHRTVTMRGGLIGDEEFLAWEPGKHLAFRFNTASTSAIGAFIEEYLIVPTATGCDLTWKLGQELNGPSRHFTAISTPISNAMFRRFLRNLQKLTAGGVPAVTS
jgi:uncharacterized protein YndB with AHSA1/START domain